MPIYNFPGYLTKEEAAARWKVQVRAINDRIRRKVIPFVIVDGLVFISNGSGKDVSPEGISLASLERVEKFGPRHNISAERIYSQIIMGKISGVIICNRVFIIKNEPDLLLFVKEVAEEKKNSAFHRKKAKMGYKTAPVR